MTPAPPAETLTAGRELDQRVCLALGIEWQRIPCPDGDGSMLAYPAVSTDAGECWRFVVPAMQARGLLLSLHDTEEHGWLAVFRRPLDSVTQGRAIAATIAEALSLAALAAVAGQEAE